MCPISFAKFFDEILGLYEGGRAPATVVKMRQVLAEVRALPGVETTADLTPTTVARFVASCRRPRPRLPGGRSAGTILGLCSYLRRACSYAAGQGYLERSPFAAWADFVGQQDREDDAEDAQARSHSLDAIRRVLGHLGASAGTWEGGRLRALAAVLAFTGLRRNEALFLQVRDVDLELGVIRVSGRRRLKRRTAARKVPFGPELRAILADWLPRCGSATWVFPGKRGVNAWHGGAPGYRPADRLEAAGEAVGVPRFLPHSLRHSFATLCATLWNVPPAVLQNWMGHTDLKTTMRYYVHLDQATSTAHADRVRFDLGHPPRPPGAERRKLQNAAPPR